MRRRLELAVRRQRPAGSRLPSSRPSIGCGVGCAVSSVATSAVGHHADPAARAAALSGIGASGSGCRPRRRGRRRVRPSTLSRSATQPLRDLVDGRRGDDEQAEDRQQHEQRDGDHAAAEQVGDHGRADVADGAAGFTHRLLAAAGPRQAVLDVDQAEDAERDRRPPDDRPAGRAVQLGSSACVRQAASSTSSGTAYAAIPNVPSTTARMAWPTEPGSRHHSAALITMASPTRPRPRPSRRCSGSRSRAVVPMRRTTAPMTWAMPEPDGAQAAADAGQRAG